MEENTYSEFAYSSREELIAKVNELRAEISNLYDTIGNLQDTIDSHKTLLTVANEGLESWQRRVSKTQASVQALCEEYAEEIDGNNFFQEIVDLFDIELTKTVTVQYQVSIEVQATVPITMDNSEVEQELANATITYEFWGNGDVVIENYDISSLEVE